MEIEEKLRNAEYWADQLQRIARDADPILTKLWEIPCPDLNIEDRILLRYILSDYKSIVHLLSEDMAEPAPEPLPFYKRLFKK